MERLAFTCRISRQPEPVRLPAGWDRAGGPGRAGRAADEDKVAYYSLLVFIFALFLRPQDQIPFMDMLHLADISGALALLALVIGRMNRGVPITRLTPELAGVFALSALALAFVPLSIWPGGSVRYFTDVFVKIVIIFAVMVNTLTTRARLQKVMAAIVIGATFIAIRAVLDYARGVNLIGGDRIAGAAGGMFGNPNDMALNMVVILPLGIALALEQGRPALRLLGLVGIPAMLLAIIFTKSRGGVVGLVVMLAVLLYLMRRVRPGVAVAIVVAGLAALPLLPSSFTERITSIVHAEKDATGSREARKTLLREGFQTFLQHPLTGVGFGQFTNYNPEGREQAWRQTHNAVLQVAADLGIIGVGLFLFVVWHGFRAGAQALKTARDLRRHAASADLDWLELNAALFMASFAGWFASAMFASVAYYWTIYLLLGMACAIREISQRATAAALAAKRPVAVAQRVA
jgi:putative inorganic carbon (HCO3(-)) transporter